MVHLFSFTMCHDVTKFVLLCWFVILFFRVRLTLSVKPAL